jgi:hypothetical protein
MDWKQLNQRVVVLPASSLELEAMSADPHISDVARASLNEVSVIPELAGIHCQVLAKRILNTIPKGACLSFNNVL